MADATSNPDTFTPEALRELQASIPARIQSLSEHPAFASANLDDAERVATWYALLKGIEAKLDAFEADA